VGSKTKHNTKSFADTTVESTNIANNAVTSNKIGADAVTSAKINNGTITTDDLSSTLDLSSKTVTLPSSAISFDSEYYNIGLLGFKMAVNESLTVFNLVDGVVDEFNDESGTDEAEGSNDTYNSTDDYYVNSDQVGGVPVPNPCQPFSAGFSTTAITEPDSSTTGTNPAVGSGTFGQFTVPTDMTSLVAYVWGAGGGSGGPASPYDPTGGGGGFSTGTLAVTPGQTIYVSAGEGGSEGGTNITGAFYGGGEWSVAAGGNFGGGGGGISGLFTAAHGCLSSAPQAYLIAGSGGGGGSYGGAGGGPTGCAGGTQTEQTNAGPSRGPQPQPSDSGGGGSQTQGGQAGSPSTVYSSGTPGSLFQGGDSSCRTGGTPADSFPFYAGTGGAGYYGGGGGSTENGSFGAGGGGSSYISHPQISSASTEEGGGVSGGGTGNPNYVAGTNEGGPVGGNATGEDGYVLLTGTGTSTTTANTLSTTIISNAFTSTSVATSARIVVFEENVATPTLNTDIIASVSRDGTNFTNATLSDSGYVTGSSGQRILTGQADISGQPSGQSMRWKLQLANNTVKIHGVSLSWA